MYKNLFDLTGKNIVVTGGLGLLGREISMALAEHGARVIICDINDEEGIKAEKDFKSKELKAKYMNMDITNEDNVSKCFNQIKKEFGSLDGLINNAYPRTSDWGNKFEDIDIESWRKNVDMHMNGYFICAQKAAEIMKTQNFGTIINFGSIYGVVGPQFYVYENTNMTMPAAYSAIKGGIINLTRYLSSYLGKNNIRVNAICPGGVFDNQNEEFVKRYGDVTPLKRMAKKEEIPGSVVFLCSEAASYITGHILMVDGGWTAC